MNMPAGLALNCEAWVIRTVGYVLTPVQLQVRALCTPAVTDSDQLQLAGHRSAVAVQLMHYWLTEMLPHTVIVNPLSEMGEQLMYTCDNRVMLTPGTPDDFLLVRLLHSKLSAIARSHVQVHSVTVKTSDTGHSERIWSSTEYALPQSDYMGSDIVHSVPWWQRASIDICDILVKDAQQQGDNVEDLVNLTDPLAVLEAELDKHFSDSEPAEIIDNIWKS